MRALFGWISNSREETVTEDRIRRLERRLEELEDGRIRAEEIGTKTRPFTTVYMKSRTGKIVEVKVEDDGASLSIKEI